MIFSALRGDWRKPALGGRVANGGRGQPARGPAPSSPTWHPPTAHLRFSCPSTPTLALPPSLPPFLLFSGRGSPIMAPPSEPSGPNALRSPESASAPLAPSPTGSPNPEQSLPFPHQQQPLYSQPMSGGDDGEITGLGGCECRVRSSLAGVGGCCCEDGERRRGNRLVCPDDPRAERFQLSPLGRAELVRVGTHTIDCSKALASALPALPRYETCARAGRRAEGGGKGARARGDRPYPRHRRTLRRRSLSDRTPGRWARFVSLQQWPLDLLRCRWALVRSYARSSAVDLLTAAFPLPLCPFFVLSPSRSPECALFPVQSGVEHGRVVGLFGRCDPK